MREVVLLSGGMDSYITWWLLNRERKVDGFYVRLRHRYMAVELEALRHLGAPLTQVDNLDLSSWEADDAHIPYRNLLLATMAAVDGADVIHLGALAGDMSLDKSHRFLRSASHTLTQAEGRRVALRAPFRNLTKTQLLRRYLAADGPIWELRQTRSCYEQESFEADFVGCGACGPCFRRFVAMHLNNLHENLHRDPREWEGRRGALRRHAAAIRRQPLRSWPGMIRLNLEALRACT